MEEIFGHVTVVKAAALPDEAGYVTEVMTEREFREKAEKLSAVISRIRIED